MQDSQRFSILTFPQYFSGTTLGVNIVVLPRNQNPLADAIIGETAIPDAPPFADARLSFTASIFDGLEVFPHSRPPISGIDLPVTAPTDARAIYEALAAQLHIVPPGMINSNADLKAVDPTLKASQGVPRERTVKKYLPLSYREAFNFTRPRHANLVTDDSYHCAIRDGQRDPNFPRSPETVTWGKVFAYLMRQPLLAERAGLIYSSSFEVDTSYFADGGWLFVDLAADSDYRDQLDAADVFVHRYAARIPRLVSDEPRQVFATVQFPVLFKGSAGGPNPQPPGKYDQLFVEAATYDDGFAKIVHSRQPVNRDLLEEAADGAYPVKDVGISLGWDDEEITDRYIRQMEDVGGTMGGRLDAPLGVFGYAIDVRAASEPPNEWESLNYVESDRPLVLGNPTSPGDDIELGDFAGELPYQVYPMQVDGQKTQSYWLPMYFADWSGHSMVVPNREAAAIYRTDETIADPLVEDPLHPENDTGTGVTKPTGNASDPVYQPGPIETELRYGNSYEFRVRMTDLSGGAPDLERSPTNKTVSDTTRCQFKRYIAPNQPRIIEIESGSDGSSLVNTDTPAPISELNVRRPKLGYPAVVFTGKYSDPVQRLIKQSELGVDVDPDADPTHRVGLGIADPDIDRIEITVEIATVKLDKAGSVSKRDDYVFLYKTTRSFPTVNSDNDYDEKLSIPIEYRDVHVLHTGDSFDLTADLGLADDIDDLAEIVLPTARTVRLTIRAVAEDKDDNLSYYGVVDDDRKLDIRYGEPVQLQVYSPSSDETDLLEDPPGVPAVQGIFLQPDLVTSVDGRLNTLLLGNMETVQRDNVSQLAAQIQMKSSGLTLNGDKGKRVVFGCTSRIRHTLAPDGSSITFASKGDLINHWLVVISFDVNRDWMWDALENRSFVVRRTKGFTHDDEPEETDVVVGDVSVVRTASFESLDKPDRNSWRIVFIDAVEPKKSKADDAAEPDFPDTIELEYTIETQFKPDHGDNCDEAESLELSLPITTPPTQVPKIASAGIALSPYVPINNYSETQVRQRYLWIEFAEPIKDPQDTFFARVLAVAPDQLLSSNNVELLRAPEEAVLPIDPEYIRVFASDATNDLAGLDAMAPMEKSTSSDRHYLLPLPPGLHADADEMFGFFTYEFRVGHYRHPDDGEDPMVWTTAQGRFGRRIRATGIQHPAPTLTCMANRDGDKLWVTAPYAVAVHNGKNVTANPPRTELWALLYAQVKQADDKEYRNVLLDDRHLDWRIQVEHEVNVDVVGRYTGAQRDVLRSVAARNFTYEINSGAMASAMKLVDYSTKSKDGTRYGTVIWSQKEIEALLGNLGLQLTSSLSVLVVETLPQITNIYEHVSEPNSSRSNGLAETLARMGAGREFRRGVEDAELRSSVAASRRPSPVSDGLGHQRLLRTSPLTPVPPTCPPD